MRHNSIYGSKRPESVKIRYKEVKLSLVKEADSVGSQ